MFRKKAQMMLKLQHPDVQFKLKKDRILSKAAASMMLDMRQAALKLVQYQKRIDSRRLFGMKGSQIVHV